LNEHVRESVALKIAEALKPSHNKQNKPCETEYVQNSGFGQCLGSYPCPDHT